MLIDHLAQCRQHIVDKFDTLVWGVSIHADLLFTVDRLIEAGFDPTSTKWIWLVRRDKIAQALSHIRAKETQIYKVKRGDTVAKQQNDMPVFVTAERLSRYALRNFFMDQMWETFFYRYQISSHRIYYEEFLDEATWDRNIAKILEFLGISFSLPLNVDSRLVQQAQEENPRAYEIVRHYAHNYVNNRYLPFVDKK